MIVKHPTSAVGNTGQINFIVRADPTLVEIRHIITVAFINITLADKKSEHIKVIASLNIIVFR